MNAPNCRNVGTSDSPRALCDTPSQGTTYILPAHGVGASERNGGPSAIGVGTSDIFRRSAARLLDALEQALDDERIMLPPRAKVRLRHRLVEIIDDGGLVLVAATEVDRP